MYVPKWGKNLTFTQNVCRGGILGATLPTSGVITHPHYVPVPDANHPPLVMLRLSMGRAVPLSPSVPAWHVVGQPLANIFQRWMLLKKCSGQQWRWFKKYWYAYKFITLLYVEYTVVGLVRSQQLDGLALIPGRDERFFSFLRQSNLAPGTIQPTVYWVLGMLSMGARR